MITGLLIAMILGAFFALMLQISFKLVHLGYVDIGPTKYVTSVTRIVYLALLAGPLGGTEADIGAHHVLAIGIGMLARITVAVGSHIDLAMRAGCARRTVTMIAHAALDATSTTVQTWLSVAIGSGKFAIHTVITIGTCTRMTVLLSRAHTAILTRRAVAKVDFDFAMTAHIARLAVAVIIVDQLHAVLSAG